uniref:Uncharacterized protein n=1 Tax=Anguilla anguilla TaxID=7936 RepID=A0A0E9VQ63_ANGAN
MVMGTTDLIFLIYCRLYGNNTQKITSQI